MTDDEKRPDETPSTPEDVPPPSKVTPPGQLLKEAREAAKLNVEDVARELRMTATKVRDLEADDYDKLHSDTFVRGYLRTYAKLLDLDPGALLDAYLEARRAQGWDESAEESPIQVSIPQPTKPLWRFALVILVLLAGLWALSVWFLDNRQAPSPDAALSDSLPDTSLQRVASEEPPAASGVSNDDPEPPAENTVGETSEETQPGELSEQAPSPEVEALASTETGIRQASYTDPDVLDQLVLEFSDECWVEVVDARGDVLQTNLIQAGRVLQLSGEAPFNVKLGNAEAVTLSLNGEPYAFEAPAGSRPLTLNVSQ